MTLILNLLDGTFIVPTPDQTVIEEPDGAVTILGPHDNVRGVQKGKVVRDAVV